LFLLYVKNKIFWAKQKLGGAAHECPRDYGPGHNHRLIKWKQALFA